MNILVRVDATANSGSGHLIRCLSLASALISENINVEFIGNIELEQYKQLITKHKIGYHHLPHLEEKLDAKQTLLYAKQINASLIIVDSYLLTEIWQKYFLKKLPLFAMEDIPNRKHVCQLLLDPTISRKKQEYAELIPNDCITLLGENYTLLRREFNELHKKIITNKKRPKAIVENILIFFGGTDPTGATYQIAKALPLNYKITALLNPISPAYSQVKRLTYICPHITLIDYCEDMANFMLKFDLIIGAPSSNSWERCCLGIPALTFTLADNQKDIAKIMQKHGAAVNFGSVTASNIEQLIDTLQKLQQQPSNLQAMSDNATKLCDGLGAQRISKEIINYINLLSLN